MGVWNCVFAGNVLCIISAVDEDEHASRVSNDHHAGAG